MKEDRLLASLQAYGSLDREEAIQIFLWLFCTTNVLPPHLQGEEISTELLIKNFETLSEEGRVRERSGGTGPKIIWSTLHKALLSGHVVLDDDFGPRVASFLGDPAAHSTG